MYSIVHSLSFNILPLSLIIFCFFLRSLSVSSFLSLLLSSISSLFHSFSFTQYSCLLFSICFRFLPLSFPLPFYIFSTVAVACCSTWLVAVVLLYMAWSCCPSLLVFQMQLPLSTWLVAVALLLWKAWSCCLLCWLACFCSSFSWLDCCYCPCDAVALFVCWPVAEFEREKIFSRQKPAEQKTSPQTGWTRLIL